MWSSRGKRVLLIAAILLLLAFIGLKMLALHSARQPPELGLTREQRLPACPDAPNCVNSEDPDTSRQVEPLTFEGDPDDAWIDLQLLLQTLPRVSIRSTEPTYLHATMRSRFLGFVDDLEFRLDRDNRRIHIRAASRVGHSDLGANARHAQTIHNAWQSR